MQPVFLPNPVSCLLPAPKTGVEDWGLGVGFESELLRVEQHKHGGRSEDKLVKTSRRLAIGTGAAIGLPVDSELDTDSEPEPDEFDTRARFLSLLEGDAPG